jgi:hypothetical protein
LLLGVVAESEGAFHRKLEAPISDSRRREREDVLGE